MPRDPRTHLEHIRESIELIERYLGGLTYEAYVADDLVRDGVERRFIVIAEALTRLLRDEPGLSERVTEAGSIRAFRNLVVHVYDRLDYTIVWKVSKTDLPVLKREVLGLLEELG